MAQYNQSGIPTYVSASAISKHLRVVLLSNKTVQIAGASDKDIGTAERATFAVGEDIPVRLRNTAGTTIMVAAGVIGYGQQIFAAAGGKVGTDSINELLGISHAIATADGDLIEVLRLEGGDGSPLAIDLADSVANMAARPVVTGKPDGYRVTVATNALTFTVVDGNYVPEWETTVDTLASRDALTELVTDQRVYVNETDLTYRWDGVEWKSVVAGITQIAGWSVVNPSADDRTLDDGANTTVQDLTRVLGTLIEDLKTAGIFLP